MGYRPLDSSDAGDIAKIHRRSIFWAVEKFPDLHTPTQDVDFFKSELSSSKGYAYLGSDGVIQGFILWRQNWFNHLYLDPGVVRLGIGSDLLEFALAEIEEPTIQLYTFQSNTGAVAFYLKHGFKIVRAGDGSGNDEGLPDYLFILTR
jgi:ribosomal protein S18 acetylase RimI-like enzyme